MPLVADQSRAAPLSSHAVAPMVRSGPAAPVAQLNVRPLSSAPDTCSSGHTTRYCPVAGLKRARGNAPNGLLPLAGLSVIVRVRHPSAGNERAKHAHLAV